MKTTSLILGLSMAQLFGADKAGEPATSARIIHYRKGESPTINTRFNCPMITVLQNGEKVLNALWGDNSDWVVESFQGSNFVIVKPTRVGVSTVLIIVTQAGNIYTPTLQEVSQQKGARVDIQVMIEPLDDSMLAAIKDKPKFVSADAMDVLKAQLAKDQEQREAEKKEAARKLAEAQKTPVTPKLSFYRIDAEAVRLGVRSIVNTTDHTTVIYATPREAFAVYEIKDKKPSLVNYTVKDGSYIFDKILDDGYIQIGKKKATFKREG